MGNTWVTDMRHFEDVADLEKAVRIPGPAVRLGRHLGRIVEAVTARWSDRDVPLATVVPCRRHPGHKPCPGFIGAVLSVDRRCIEWGCSNCSDQGYISGWQGTPWDFSNVVGLGFAPGDKWTEVVVTPDEFAAVNSILTFDREAERVVKAARLGPEDDEIVIGAPRAWLDNLMEHVAAEANATRSRKVRTLLESVLDRPIE